MNLAPVQSHTRVIHHSGHSSNYNWHIKKICSDSIIDALPEAKVSLLWGSDVIISHPLGLTQTEVKLWRKQVCGVSLKGTFAENMGGEEMEDEKVG